MCTLRRNSILLSLSLAAAGAAFPAQLQPQSGAQPAESEILWDKWGVPHVYGRTTEDVGWGFGWAQAQAHGDAILLLYGLARGRAAEYWGTTYAGSDRITRTMGLPAAARVAYRAQGDEFRRYLDAFAQGVNAYAAAHPKAIPDSLKRVLPVTGEDLVAHGHRVMFTFLSFTGGRNAPVDEGGMPRGPVPGSNGWAIGRGRSASGNAMLLANPHLSWRVPLMRFTEAQLVGPGMNITGVTLIGLPVIAIGFNDRLGWSHTVNTIDALDVFELRLTERGYRMDGQEEQFDTHTDTVRVRQRDGSLLTVPLTIRSSVHGPVIRESDSTAHAVRVEALTQTGMLRQWWDMGRARSLEEFEGALRQLQISMFNVLYADRDGHIFFLFNGRVPVRGQRTFYQAQGLVRGDTSATLWRGVHGYDDLPRIVDPPSGFVQNSNSPPWFATLPSPLDTARFPSYMAPRWLGLREQRALQMLQADSSITFNELLAMRYDNHMLLADRLLDDLIPAARASGRPLALAAADVLERWDRAAEKDSRGAVLFALWAARMFDPFPITGRNFKLPWNPAEPTTTPDGLARPELAVQTLEQVAQTMNANARMDSIDVPWGKVNLLGGEPGNGAPGDPLGVFHVLMYDSIPPFEPVFGETYVAAVEFTPDGPRAQAVLSYGNSSQPGSPHGTDQLPLVAGKQMRPVWRARAEVEANLESRTPINRVP
jgi:acyl-homoserine-lactone acylase